MKSIRKLILAGVSALAVLAVVAAPAAFDLTPAWASSSEIPQRAEFAARGRGNVKIVNINDSVDQDSVVITGRGKIKIVDLAGDAQIKAVGWNRESQSGNESIYKGYGRLAIKGTNVEVTFDGQGYVWAKGNGRAALTGRGTWKLGGVDRGRWSKNGVNVDF